MIDLIISVTGLTDQSVVNLQCAVCCLYISYCIYTGTVIKNTGNFTHCSSLYHAIYRYTFISAVFLIYNGPGQFESLKNYPQLWEIISTPWICAMVALALNSAAYSTLLFHGAVKAIPAGQWQSCQALGMSKLQTMRIILPYAFKRALSSYSNEVVLIFKSTSLASTITLLDVMGYSRLVFGQTYDVMVFVAAGIIYLCVNALLTLIMRIIERRALAFEYRD